MSHKVKISICMLTYGHEKFIAEAINGVLMQECDFEVELIIANDCSPDDTDFVIQDILNNHPRSSWIKYIKQEKNLGSQLNFLFVLNQCNCKYIALCEGDDYWNDPLKLQKQIDFLEANPDYVMCYHDIYVIDEKGTHVRDSVYYNFNKIDYTKEQLINSPFLMPLTMCFRNVITDFPKEFVRVVNGDVFLISMLGQYGKGKFQADIISASYRMHGGGVSSMVSELEKEYQRKNTFYQLFCYYHHKNEMTSTSHNFFIKHKNSTLRLLQKMLQERQMVASLKLSVEFLLKCIKNGLWRESAYIIKDYLKLIKNNL